MPAGIEVVHHVNERMACSRQHEGIVSAKF
jgi:hypothetical protein